jgi:predicted metal-dependent phosphoesterase TrpH
MKFDMHCHTKEGSIDSRVPIKEYAEILKSKGFAGMLVTDHDSYKGWHYSKEHRASMPRDFVVLMGIEYDTRDAGHFIVIMPDGVHLHLLELRGMSVKMLTKIVHEYGGVLGPAHPFGMRSSSLMFCYKMKTDADFMNSFDFLEGLNTCERVRSNELARDLADKYDLQCIGGSDSHKAMYVGTAWTDFDRDIKCNNDMIAAIREEGIAAFGGKERTYKPSHGKRNWFATTWSFKAFNRGLGILYAPSRKSRIKSLLPDDK